MGICFQVDFSYFSAVVKPTCVLHAVVDGNESQGPKVGTDSPSESV